MYMRIKTKRNVKSIICILIFTIFLMGCGETIIVDENVNSKSTEESLHDAEAMVTEKLETATSDKDKSEEIDKDGKSNLEEEIEPIDETSEESKNESAEESKNESTEEFSVESINKVMYPNRNLNVRTGPSTSYTLLGSVGQNQELNVTGITENGWYEIDYNGQKGYCSGRYLVNEPVVITTPKPVENPVDTASSEVPTEVPTEVVTEAPVETEAPVVTASASVNELLNAVNADRAANGLAALTLDSDLQNTAAVRASEISILFDHTRPDGTACFTAFPASAGPSRAENIYMISVATTAAEVEAAWMASPGHRENILNSKYTKIGIGIYQASNGYWYFVQDFSN